MTVTAGKNGNDNKVFYEQPEKVSAIARIALCQGVLVPPECKTVKVGYCRKNMRVK